jgi:hypothetical protein|tara:strand:+ start:191 stop:325 length:135 start_codon:yes stop_codon:yes gene_type:complete
MEHLFNALGDLVQAITYAGLTIFFLYLMDLLFGPETREEKDKDE